MVINITLIIGTIGMLFLLTAFVLNLFKKVTQDSTTYNIFNIMGGGLLTYYAYALNSLPFLILEAIWTMFAICKLVIISKKEFGHRISF